MLATRLADAARAPHLWWGVSVEDRRHGLPRLELLRAAPAAMKFLSIEPLLEDLGEFTLEGIDWAIVGGESGAGARAMEQAWVENVLARCRAAGTPFFFKQWGGVRKSARGRELHGRTYDERPAREERAVPSRGERMAMLAGVMGERVRG